MTAPAKAAPMREDVTQADRTLFANFLEDIGNLLNNDRIGQLAHLLREGAYNDVVARHRLAHTARPDAVLLRDTLRRAQAHVAAMVAPDDRDGITRRILADCSTALSAARPDAGDEDAERLAKSEIVAILRKHIECDATGLAPAVASVFLRGFEEAADALTAAMREGVDRGMVERAKALIDDAMDNAGAFDPGEVVVPISVAYAVSAAALDQPR